MKLHIQNNKASFDKTLWSDHEKHIASCLGMSRVNGSFEAELASMSKKALFEFIKLFVSKGDDEPIMQHQMAIHYDMLKLMYMWLEKDFRLKMIEKLPYYNKLYDHQTQGIFQMCHRKHNLLSFEQGLGKTVTAISVSRMLSLKTTLIICPAVCKWNWYEELQKWGIDKRFASIIDSNKDIKATDVERFIIINYDMLKKYGAVLSRNKNIEHIVFDECHYLKSVMSQRHKYASLIASATGAKMSFLSGTPVKNRVEDLFAYLKMINHPLGQDYYAFVNQYTFFYDTQWGMKIVKGKNLEELSVKISNFVIRRLKKDCLDIPDKVYTKYFFDFNDFKSEYYDKIKMIATNGIKHTTDVQSSIHTLSVITTKSKIPDIIALAEDILYEGRKVVLFTSYTEPLRMLKDYFKDKSVAIDGSVAANKRQDLINRFNNDESCQVFIGNMQAAGIGVNLVSASDVIFCNFPFTVSELNQAIDRLHRIGQKNQVNVYYTICRGSVDEDIYQMIVSKNLDIANVIDNGYKTIELDKAESFEFVLKKIISNNKEKCLQ